MYLEVPEFCVRAIFYFWIKITGFCQKYLVKCFLCQCHSSKTEATPEKSEKILSKYTAEMSAGDRLCMSYFSSVF